MKQAKVRTVVATVFAAAACLAVSARPGAATKDTPIDRFVAMAPDSSDPGSASRIDIFIERWSSEQEQDNLREMLTRQGPGGLLLGLQNLPLRTGTVLTPGVGGGRGPRVFDRRPRNLWFARRIDTKEGRRLIIATDRELAFGEPELKWSKDFQFTLLDIRFGLDGKGIGKVASASDVAYNKHTKTFEVANFASHPSSLVDVRQEAFGR